MKEGGGGGGFEFWCKKVTAWVGKLCVLWVEAGVNECECVRKCTAWCSEIGSLWSLDAPELHASLTSENQFHCTRLYYVEVFDCLG